MSYSLNDKCVQCKKRDKCVDREFIVGAISGIHSNTLDKGHLGSGSIDLICQNFDQKDEAQK